MFHIGDFVRFKYTGMLAEILKDQLDGSYTVWLDEDDEEGIAFEDDIVLASEFKQVEESIQQKSLKKAPKPLSTEEMFYSKEELKAKHGAALNPQNNGSKTKSSSKKDSSINTFSPSLICPTAPSNSGCYIILHQTNFDAYTIYLVNDSLYSLGFEFKLFLNKKLDQGFNKLIPPNTYFPIGELLQEQFNDAPEIHFSCSSLELNKVFKLKYQKLINTLKEVPLMGLRAYSYLVVQPSVPNLSTTSPSLTSYTTLQLKEKDSHQKTSNKYYRRSSLKEIAALGNELDLHAEKLVEDTSVFTSKELYELQLEALDKFINKVIEIGLKEVFIIHGIGKGILKQAVDDYLRYHKDVVSYKSEFHEKYGFGATRVLF